MPERQPTLTVLFLTHYFPPEVGAPQTRLFELAKRLVDAGIEVTVVTGFPNYPTGVIARGYRGRTTMEDNIEGVRVLRTWVFATPNRGFLRRILNHLSFALSSLLAARRAGKADVIFVESPPLLIGLAALAYSRIKRAPFVFNVSDIWPQSAIELGALRNGLAILLAEALEMHLYRRAARVSVVTPGMVERLAARGVPREKLFLLTNGVDTTTFRPQRSDPDLASHLGLDGRKVFLYAGTHGMAQGLDVILDAARLTTDPSVLYVLAGEGAEKAALASRARSEGIGNVRFIANQPKSAMPGLLNLAYATIIPLKRLDLFKSALPSKMFEAMATGRPIVAAMWGEAATLVELAGCGVVVEPEDAPGMEKAVEQLAADPELARTMGEKGRAYAVEHFDRKQIAKRSLDLLREVAATAPAASPSRVGFALSVISVAIVAWLPVLIGYRSRTLAGWIAAAVLAVAIELATRRLSPAVLVAGLAVASALVSSGLVTDETRYMPVAIMGGAASLRAARVMWRRRQAFPAPPRPIVVVTALYLAWAAVATLSSIEHRTSGTYLAGMVLFFALAFWAIPHLLEDRQQRALLLGALGGIGVAIAVSIYIGSIAGPKLLFGRVVGDYLIGDPTIVGHALGLRFGRSAGVYLAPFEPGVLMVVGMIALIALRTRASLVALLFIIPAEVLSLDRSAWSAAAATALVFAALLAIAGRPYRLAAAVGAFFTVLLVAVLLNVVGVNAVEEICIIPVPAGGTCPDWAIQYTEANLRGGAALSGRQFLWAASVRAVRARPLSGYGPGNDVPAIQPYLSGNGLIYKGLTSHSTWLRTAVEMGAPGLVLLLAMLLTAAWLFLRSWTTDPIQLSFAATVAGLVPAMTFESFLLGGITLPNLYPALAIGLLLTGPRQGGEPGDDGAYVIDARQEQVADAKR
jgi:glycosyltransferase involved in cell wall biosynthesis